MLTVLFKELNAYLNSIAAYVAMIVFLIGLGLICWVFPQTSILEYGYANLDPLFNTAPYVFMFLIPAITMRSLAEEKKSGTIELLLTRPITDWEIVSGKFLASLLIILLTLLPTSLYYYSVHALGAPEGNIDTAAVLGSYLGLVFLAAAFTAIGVFASALTDNQIVAFIVAVFVSFFLYDGFSSLAMADFLVGNAYLISQLGIDFHYALISKGLVDFKNVIYFLTVTLMMLFAARLVLKSRKW